ncbi:hypothetical protein V6Z12_A01G044300 [Gossypium hirsutum]
MTEETPDDTATRFRLGKVNEKGTCGGSLEC